jgi:hypothetical protein
MVLLLACAMVVTDFVRHPFAGAPPGSAATERRDLTLWTAGTDAGSTPGQLARAAARALDRPGERVFVRAVDGGVASAVAGLLDDETGAGDDLLVVHAGTFADLEQERRTAGVPDLARRAARAERLLLRARPVALLADDALLVAATRRSHLRSAGQLAAALRSDTDALVLGVEGDVWSRNALAALVDASGAHGPVRYRVLPAENQAAFLDRGAVDAVVGPASMLRRGGLGSRLVPLARSGGGALPTLGALVGAGARPVALSRWVAVVAAPALGEARAALAARRLRRLTASHRWRRTVAGLGLGAPPRDRGGLLADAHRDAQRLTVLAGRLDRASAGR